MFDVRPLHLAEVGVSIIFPPLYVCVLNTKLRAGGGDVGSRNVAPRVAAAFGHQHFVSCPSTHQLVWHLMRAYISPVQAHPMCTASLYRVLHLHICSCSQWRIWHFSIYCKPYTVYCGYFPISHITIVQFQPFSSISCHFVVEFSDFVRLKQTPVSALVDMK